jgi:hemoglobin
MSDQVVSEPLYDRMGGEPVLRAVIDDFVERVFSDIMIGFLFRNADRARIKALEFEHASEFLGGPEHYSGRAMRTVHAPHRITIGQFGRRIQLLRQVCATHAVPADVQQAWLAHNQALQSQIVQSVGQDCD